MTEDRELMSMLAEALADFDAPIGNSIFEHGASGSGSASSLFPFHAFTASSQALHDEMADPATLRLLADALDAFDEPDRSGGTCVHVARSVKSSNASSQYPRVSSSLNTSSTSLYPTVDSKSETLATGTQSAPRAAQYDRADWGGQSYHSATALIKAACSTQTLTAHRRSQHTNANSKKTLTALRQLSDCQLSMQQLTSQSSLQLDAGQLNTGQHDTGRSVPAATIGCVSLCLKL